MKKLNPAICFKVPNSKDKQAIVNAFDFIESSGLASLNVNADFKYKTDAQTLERLNPDKKNKQDSVPEFLYSSTDVPRLRKKSSSIIEPGILIKWLVIGAVIASILYWSGGLAAIPFLAAYVAKLSALSIIIAAPILGAAAAALWHCIIEPLSARKNATKVEEPLLPHNSRSSISANGNQCIEIVDTALITPGTKTGTDFFPREAEEQDKAANPKQIMNNENKVTAPFTSQHAS